MARRKTEDQRARAIRVVIKAMERRGWDRSDLAKMAKVDRDTVNSFLDNERWPQQPSRNAMEDALGLTRGAIELAASGMGDIKDKATGDPVERAIEASDLTRANKKLLTGQYFLMLDGQSREVGTG
jgi:ribosome-binding protein aMBF1 (putative translation factor)